MGTYTTNYNLFMPSVGEQGWGDLVNGNFTTIDTTMKGLDTTMKGLNTRMGTAETNITSLTSRMGTAETTIASNKSRIGTLETEADVVEARVTVLENTIPEEGVVNGSLTGFHYVTGEFTLGSGDEIYATCAQQSGGMGKGTSSSFTVTVNDYIIEYDLPHRHTWGVYTRRSDIRGYEAVHGETRILTLRNNIDSALDAGWFYIKVSCSALGLSNVLLNRSVDVEVEVGKSYYFTCVGGNSSDVISNGKWSIAALDALYVTYDKP